MVAVALPILESGGTGRRVRIERTLSGQAFCNVVSLDGSCFGRSTLTLPMFAWVPNAALG